MQMESLNSMQMSGQMPPEGDDRKKMSEEADRISREMIHHQFLVQEIARLENISVTEEDINKSMEETAEMRGVPIHMVRAEYSEERHRMELMSQLLERKLFDFALPRVKIIDKELPDQKEDGENE